MDPTWLVGDSRSRSSALFGYLDGSTVRVFVPNIIHNLLPLLGGIASPMAKPALVMCVNVLHAVWFDEMHPLDAASLFLWLEKPPHSSLAFPQPDGAPDS